MYKNILVFMNIYDGGNSLCLAQVENSLLYILFDSFIQF